GARRNARPGRQTVRGLGRRAGRPRGARRGRAPVAGSGRVPRAGHRLAGTAGRASRLSRPNERANQAAAAAVRLRGAADGGTAGAAGAAVRTIRPVASGAPVSARRGGAHAPRLEPARPGLGLRAPWRNPAVLVVVGRWGGSRRESSPPRVPAR